MSSTMLVYKELGLQVVDPLQDLPFRSRRPPMEKEKSDDGAWDPFKLLLKEAPAWQRNYTMNKFTQILRRLPKCDAYLSRNHFGGTDPFKVKFKFDIPLFEGQIYSNSIYKWLNFLEVYFLVHNFSNRENISFALLKDIPDVKDW